VLLDIWMPDTDGVTLLKEWSTTGLLTMPVIMMSGHATIDTAVEATKIGAQSFLEKPITLQKLLKAVEAGPGPQRHGAQAPCQRRPWPGRPDGGSRHDRRPQPAPRGGNGPPARQLFELDKPLRDARDEFEKLL
jgi:hypothetical protein